MSDVAVRRRLPVGADVVERGVHFRVWAPLARRVEVVLDGVDGGGVALDAREGGFHEGVVEGVGEGARYRYRLDGGDALPDPASRFQPEGPLGPSEVVDPGAFRWTDDGWRGPGERGRVIYELHVGTFTKEGTWASAARELPFLAELGVTVVEMMPVNEFEGRFGWGYDGVDLFAPTRLYGRPDDLRAFVDRAHALGIAVILDVVYNHLGARGNVLGRFSGTYVSRTHTTDWGDALNFDGEGSGPVRELVVANAGYWIDEFHLDGLRIDATQDIHDRWDDHVLSRIAARVREAARGRRTLLVGENEPQDRRMVTPIEAGGAGLDALWNDDFHHTTRVAATGRAEAYFQDYRGTPQELISALRWGFLYQGQWYRWQGQTRGTPALDLPARAFVHYLQNHDQVANGARGARLVELAGAPLARALTALLLLGPQTPLLFQGQEFAASTPFLYFADHEEGELRPLVCGGRAAFLAQFPSIAPAESQAALPDPCTEETFRRCKLDLEERTRNGVWVALHRDLLRLRREDPVFAAERADRTHGAVLGPAAFALRLLDGEHGDRLVLANLGADLDLGSVAEPLLAPPPGDWRIVFSTESPAYGGGGTPPVEAAGAYRLPARSVLVLAGERRGEG